MEKSIKIFFLFTFLTYFSEQNFNSSQDISQKNMKLNDNIYYYKPKMRLYGSWVFIIKGIDNKYQYMVEASTAKKGARQEEIVEEMKAEGIEIKDTKGIFLTVLIQEDQHNHHYFPF